MLIPHKEVSKVDPKAIRQSYLEKIESSIEKDGVVMFDERHLNINADYLAVPQDITDVPSKELGEYLNAFTQQKVYLRTLLGRASLLVEEAKRAYLTASNPIYADLSKGKLSETAKERIVNSDESVVEAYNNYTDYNKKRSLIEISIANIEDIIFMLSREVTRRTGDFSEENRAYNVSKR